MEDRQDPARCDEALEFLRLLWAVDHQLQAASKRMLARAGITSPQRFVIRMLGRNPGLGASQLAEMLHDHPSTLTGVLQRLEEKGLIQMSIHPQDARRAVLELTDLGREIDNMREGTVECMVARALAGMDPAQTTAARVALATIASAIQAEIPKNGDNSSPC